MPSSSSSSRETIWQAEYTELSGALKLGELAMALVWLSIERNHALAVEGEEVRWMGLVEGMGEHGFRWVGKALTIEPVRATEIGNAARRGHASPAKEDRARMGIEQIP